MTGLHPSGVRFNQTARRGIGPDERGRDGGEPGHPEHLQMPKEAVEVGAEAGAGHRLLSTPNAGSHCGSQTITSPSGVIPTFRYLTRMTRPSAKTRNTSSYCCGVTMRWASRFMRLCPGARRAFGHDPMG